MLVGAHRIARQRFAGFHCRQAAVFFAFGRFGIGGQRIVAAFAVQPQKAVEQHNLAGGAQLGATAFGHNADRGLLEPGGGHLACHGALPDQLVQLHLIGAQLPLHPARRARQVGGPDGLVGLLGVLRRGLVHARLFGNVGVAVLGRDHLARALDGFIGKIRAVGPHVGDQADGLAVEVDALVQMLGHAHGLPGRKTELARGLLLQRRGRERRRRVAAHLLGLDVADRESGCALDHAGGVACLGLGAKGEFLDLVPAQPDQLGGQGLAVCGVEIGLDGPVLARNKRLDVGFALADQAQCDRLHAPGRARSRQLAPQHRRQREPDQIIERAPRLLGVDEVHVEFAGVFHRRAHRIAGDLVEHHAAHRHRVEGFQLLERRQHVPRNCLAFAVGVGRQIQMTGAAHRACDALQVADRTCLGLIRDGEVFVGTDRAVLGRQVAHMAVAGEHDVVAAQILANGLGLGR